MSKPAYNVGYQTGLKKDKSKKDQSAVNKDWHSDINAEKKKVDVDIDPRIISGVLGALAGAAVGKMSEDPFQPYGSNLKVIETVNDEGQRVKYLAPKKGLENLPGWMVGLMLGGGLGAGWGQLVQQSAEKD